MVISSEFPPGTPVWYNFRDTTQLQSSQETILWAYEGVVREVSMEKGTGYLIYDVMRKNLSANSDQAIYVDSVYENNIAFGYGCPVHLQTRNSYSLCELPGEIIRPCFVSAENGDVTIKYTVKISMDDGSLQIVEGVLANRLRYRFGLDTLRAKLRRECVSNNKMVGIRTGSLGFPLKRRRLQSCDSRSHTVKTVFVHVPPVKQENMRETVPVKVQKESDDNIAEQLVSSAFNASTINNKPVVLCKNNGCHRHVKENCDGYCFAHYCFFTRSDWSVYYKRERTDSNESNSNAQSFVENTTLSGQRQTVIDLTEDADESRAPYAKANGDYIGYI